MKILNKSPIFKKNTKAVYSKTLYNMLNMCRLICVKDRSDMC